MYWREDDGKVYVADITNSTVDPYSAPTNEFGRLSGAPPERIIVVYWAGASLTANSIGPTSHVLTINHNGGANGYYYCVRHYRVSRSTLQTQSGLFRPRRCKGSRSGTATL